MTATPDPSAIPDDDTLFAELAQAWRGVGGPVTEHEREVARPARDRLGETDPFDLAELAYDSRFDHELAGAFRGAETAPCTFLFERSPLGLEVDVSADEVVGRVAPPGRATVTVELASGSQVSSETDEAGMFAASVRLSGNIRFRVEGPGGAAMLTRWVRV